MYNFLIHSVFNSYDSQMVKMPAQPGEQLTCLPAITLSTSP